MKAIGNFFIGLIIIAIALIVSIVITLLRSYIIIDVANLYKLTFITQLGLMKVFGAILLINIARGVKLDNDNDEEEEINKIVKGFKKQINAIILLLLFWSLAYISHGFFIVTFFN